MFIYIKSGNDCVAFFGSTNRWVKYFWAMIQVFRIRISLASSSAAVLVIPWFHQEELIFLVPARARNAFSFLVRNNSWVLTKLKTKILKSPAKIALSRKMRLLLLEKYYRNWGCLNSYEVYNSRSIKVIRDTCLAYCNLYSTSGCIYK